MQDFSAATLWLYQNLVNFAYLFQCIIKDVLREKIYDAYISLKA